MIRWLLVLLLAFAIAATAAHFLREETGYVLISIHDWVVETSLLGLIVGVIGAVLVLYWGVRLLIAGLRLPSTVRQALERRRSDKAQTSFEEGLLKLLEGNWKRAEVELVRRAADHHASHLNYLAAARAAQRMGAGDRRDHYLRLAAESAPEMEFATLLTQAELQQERGEYALARDTALKLRNLDPKHPYAVELLAESYHALGAWEALRSLLQDSAARALLVDEQAQQWAIRALCERLAEEQRAARLDQLKALWSSASKVDRQQPDVRRAYVRGLTRLNAHGEALALVTQTLDKEWDAELAMLYGELHAGEPLTQLAAIENWLNRYGEQPELLVTAGRACLRNQLWGKARSYLEAVVRVAPSATAYLELARLCEQSQNPAEAQKFYRMGLELAAASS